MNRIEVSPQLWLDSPRLADSLQNNYWNGLEIGDMLYFKQQRAIVASLREIDPCKLVYEIEIESPDGLTTKIRTGDDHGWGRTEDGSLPPHLAHNDTFLEDLPFQLFMFLFCSLCAGSIGYVVKHIVEYAWPM